MPNYIFDCFLLVIILKKLKNNKWSGYYPDQYFIDFAKNQRLKLQLTYPLPV